MDIKIYELDVDEELSGETGLEMIALVENPAIETDFIYFNNAFSKQQFVSDYPKGISEEAQRGIDLNEKNGNRCATQVGKVRAQQLAQRKNISVETVKRMYSYLSRAEGEYRVAKGTENYNACAYISYLLWGGEPALTWSERYLRQIGELEASDEFLYDNPCQSGYVAYGTKIKDGREVPNCVPIEASEDFDKVGEIDGVPVYINAGEAELIATKIGCEGVHQHEYEGQTVYMPCKTHSEATDAMLKDEGMTLEEMLEDGYVIDAASWVDEKVGTAITEEYKTYFKNIGEQEFYRIVTSPQLSSQQDQGDNLIRYIYAVGPAEGRPLIKTSRKFCIRMTKAQRLFRYEDILALNLELSAEDGDRTIIPRPIGTSPNIWVYKGGATDCDAIIPNKSFGFGANCRHIWIQLKLTKTPRATMRSGTARSQSDVILPAPGESGQVNQKVQYSQEVLPITYQEGLPVYEDVSQAQKQSEELGCGGKYQKITYKGRECFRPCIVVDKTEPTPQTFSIDSEKRMVYSPVFIPDLKIPRRGEKGEIYYVYFTKETIRKMSRRYMMENKQHDVNYEHSDFKFDNKIYMTESWLVNGESDKAFTLGFDRSDIPDGTWMVGYYVPDDDLWYNYIKNGKVKGVSAEGDFIVNPLLVAKEQYQRDTHIYNEIINILNKTNNEPI